MRRFMLQSKYEIEMYCRAVCDNTWAYYLVRALELIIIAGGQPVKEEIEAFMHVQIINSSANSSILMPV